MTFLV